jgi:two-component system cell cycle sensor histidine kinase/response regulator CckA
VVGVESAEYPITYDGGAAVLAIVRDIRERQRLQEHFFQAQKMEAIGSLASGVAHDFNNMLTAILGYSECLLRKFPPDTSLRNDLEQINLAGKRAAALTRQLLAFSRKQVMQPRVLDLNALVSELEKMLRRMIGEDIEMNTRLEPELGAVSADPGQLQQVIMNLAVNSRDALPQGGKITIETANVTLDKENLQGRREIPPGQYVLLSISDNGCGMDRETLSRIFEPFFTTKGQGRGTGLGLSTVYGIVKQSQGFIWVYSELGQGTTFKIYLPRAHGHAETWSSEPAMGEKKGGTETVLLVEDDASVRDLARRVLGEQGYTVLMANTGEEALLQARKFCGPIHLLLTDVVLPAMNGKVLASQIRLLRPATQVLFMSGYTNNAIVQHGVLEPGVEILEKPFVRGSLIERVRHTLDQCTAAHSILVIDGEKEVRTSIRRSLELAGFSVFEADTGHQALQLLAAHSIELVITELAMPNGRGVALIQSLRQAYPKLLIVALSDTMEGQSLKAAELSGAEAILRKPLQSEKLLAALRTLLHLSSQ